MSLPPVSLVVRNTFIDAVDNEGHGAGDSPINRTQSDPTGGRQVLNLDRILPQGLKAPEGIKEEDEVPETAQKQVEDDEDEPLARTSSVAAPQALAEIGRTFSQLSAASGEVAFGEASLQRLLTGGGEDETFASAMPPLGYPGLLQPHLMPWALPPPFPPEMLQSMSRAGKQEEQTNQSGEAEEEELDAPNWDFPVGMKHCFHQETKGMGVVRRDFRQFTKVGYEGRLSVVSESCVHQDGLHRYLVQFTAGELSRADGVGFVFSQRLPCAKNIQRIVSIFVNQRGQICMRAFAEIDRAEAFIKPLELGDVVEMAVDLDRQVCTFNVWPHWSVGWPMFSGRPLSTAEFSFGARMVSLSQAAGKAVKLNAGHLACVVKNVGVTLTLYS